MTGNHHSNRRCFIKATGAVIGSSIVAGCSGGDDGESDGEPNDNGSGDDGSDRDTGETDGDGSDFPEDDIRINIPYGGGGYNDYTRMIAPYLQDYLPNSVEVVPDNVTGGGGTVAATETYNAEPDGHTLMALNFEAFSAFQILGRGNYDILDFTYFPAFSRSTFAIGVRQDSDIETWDEYVTAVQNEEVTFGSIGPMSALSTVPWLTGEVTGLYPAENVLNNRADFDGNSEIAAAMRRGDVDIFVNATDSLRPFVESDDLRIIFIFSTEDQFRDWSDAQTLASVDIPEEDMLADPIGIHVRCFAGPPDIPEDRVQILRESITDSINDDELQEEAEEAGRPIEYIDSDSVKQSAQDYLELWEEHEDIIQSVAE